MASKAAPKTGNMDRMETENNPTAPKVSPGGSSLPPAVASSVVPQTRVLDLGNGPEAAVLPYICCLACGCRLSLENYPMMSKTCIHSICWDCLHERKLGKRLTKTFSGQPYDGTIDRYDADSKRYHVTYDDGDDEELTERQVGIWCRKSGSADKFSACPICLEPDAFHSEHSIPNFLSVSAIHLMEQATDLLVKQSRELMQLRKEMLEMKQQMKEKEEPATEAAAQTEEK